MYSHYLNMGNKPQRKRTRDLFSNLSTVFWTTFGIQILQSTEREKKKKTQLWYVKAEFRLVMPTHLLVHYCDFVPN